MRLVHLRPIASSASLSSIAAALRRTQPCIIRSASTSTSTSANSSSPSSSSSSALPSTSSTLFTQSGPLPLTWPNYLSLRRQRRLWSSITTVPSTLAGLLLGGGYFASLEADPTQTIMGLEPMWVYGGATLGCMALGYLVGPSIGGALFSLTHPSLSRGNPSPIQVMDKVFYDRIRARRVDPSYQSVNNPAPDFYGEKIVSLATYRRWLRDQAAYKRKASHGVPNESD